MNDNFYTYELAYPQSMGGAVFYVGQGQGNRIDMHEYEAKGGGKSPKCDVIRQILAAGEQIVKKKVGEHLSQLQSVKLERLLIAKYGYENLTNLALEQQWEKEPVRATLWLNGLLLEQIAACMELDGIEYTHNACQQYVHDICLDALNMHIQKKEIKAYMDAEII